MASVAFLGLGQMGSAIARSLHSQGHDLIVWNRSPERAQPLAAQGIKVAPSLAEAVKDRDIIFSMLMDDAAVEAIVFGNGPNGGQDEGILAALKPGAIHACMSTISVRLARRLTAAHSERQQFFVGAPVFGRPNVAEEGKLWIVAAGAREPMSAVQPLLASISRGLTVLSEEPWQAHALKLGGNLMITAMIQTLAEAFVYAQSQEIDPAIFHQTVNNALFQSRLYENYGKTILNPPEHPGATVTLGAKDTRLAREAAADANTRLGLADYFAEVLRKAAASGFADEDWAVGQYRVAQQDSTLDPRNR